MQENSTQEVDAVSEPEQEALTQELEPVPETEPVQENSPQELDAVSEAVPALEPDTEELPQEVDAVPEPDHEPKPEQEYSTQELESASEPVHEQEELTQELDAVPEAEPEPESEELTQEFEPVPESELEDFPQESDAEAVPEDSTQELDPEPAQENLPQESDAEPEPELSPDDEITPSVTHTLDYIDEVDPDMPTDELTEDYSIQPLNIEDVLERHNYELADKVLMRAASIPPDTFPTFVADLLSKMGYNVFQNARYTSDASGNSLIQGVILDPKAQNPIYIHAEKLSPGRTVGKSDMRDFADELAEMGGTGIFATTGDFSEQAEICAQDERIMLIDGRKLANIMINHNFCVNVVKVFELKELDEDGFSDYEN